MPNFTPIREDQLDKIGPQIIPGTEKRKSPYTEYQTKDAGFALRMEQALRTIESIEQSGFDPANFEDLFVDYLGGDETTGPKAWAERMMLSPKYKQYQRAKIDFSTAELRKETGAVINDTEIIWIDKSYFPLLDASEGERQDKWVARRTATGAMRVSAGEAFNDVKRAVEDFQSELETDTPAAALTELRRRAQEDPKLTENLRAMGLL
jgi:hypothetical protein